jgi:mycothiol synthase
MHDSPAATPRTVPAGLRLRPFAGQPDLADIVRIENAEAEADHVPERVDIETLAVRYAHPSPHFEPVRDVTIAEIDGRPVAVASREWVETTDGLREYRIDGVVDPSWRRRGIGAALLAENERRSRALARRDGEGVACVFGSWSGDSQPGDVALLTAAGFAPARFFFDMTRPSLEAIPDQPLPGGLEIRPITNDLAPAVWHAQAEAFQDHWGGVDESEERLRRQLAQPSTDLSLWIVAFDGDEVAGGVLNKIDAAENEAMGVERGWLGSVFTRRPWRRRGLAGALIVESLRRLRQRGLTSAGLGVDADNPTGALQLYERLGFEVTYRSTAWRKHLEPEDRR